MPPLSEADCFILQAAEQHGITHDPDEGTVSCTEAAFCAFINVAREQGRKDVLAPAWNPTDVHDVPHDRYMRFTMARDARDAANRPPAPTTPPMVPESLKKGIKAMSLKDEDDAKAAARAEAEEKRQADPVITPAIAVEVVRRLMAHPRGAV